MGSATRKAVTAKWLGLLALLCLFLQPAFAQSLAQSLAQATAAEVEEDFDSAALLYRKWLTTAQASGADKRHVKIRLPVLEEASQLGGGADVNLYLAALAARADKNIPLALASLDQLLENHPNSRLRDDSLYLTGYIQLMDNFDFSASAQVMSALRAEYPDSKYYDTALYSHAIAEEQQGNISSARQLLSELRERHTLFSIKLIGFAFPKDRLTSRYWFERSDQRLNIIELANKNASEVVSRTEINHPEYRWRMVVSSGGTNYTLLLKPSTLLTNSGSVANENGQTVDDGVEILSGIVEGKPDSWVRITVEGNNLSGTLSVRGTRQPLLAAATDGSLSYYNRLLRSDIDGVAATRHSNVLQPPQAGNPIDNYLNKIQGYSSKTKSRNRVTHIARLGVVIDSQYNKYYGGSGFNKALSILNTTDGIFREEFGVALHVENVVVLADRKQDPMNIGYKPMEKIIRNFRRYRMTSGKLGGDIGLATLFTGNKNSDLPMGLAWIGTACRTDGYDVSVVTPFGNGGLLSAHEIAHSMGAPHDDETSCGEGSHIMSRRITGKTKQTFSSCSVQSVKAQLAASSCHATAAGFGFE